mmetsp:Transcript_12035/g.26334  ORF Transcript_12035/g.26334 Transcript_12035/m.26334 type:complete len:145 (-) Transcript_12035:580-1014(-)
MSKRRRSNGPVGKKPAIPPAPPAVEDMEDDIDDADDGGTTSESSVSQEEIMRRSKMLTEKDDDEDDDDDDDDDPGSHAECIICMMDYEVGDLVSWSRHQECRHAFHYHCLRSWLMTHQDCPICRRSYFVEAGEGETGAREAEEV